MNVTSHETALKQVKWAGNTPVIVIEVTIIKFGLLGTNFSSLDKTKHQKQLLVRCKLNNKLVNFNYIVANTSYLLIIINSISQNELKHSQ